MRRYLPTKLRMDKASTSLMFLFLLLLVFASFNLYFTWKIPLSVLYVCAVGACILYFHYNKISLNIKHIKSNNLVLLLLLVLIYAYEYFVVIPSGILPLIGKICGLLCVSFVLFFSIENKFKLLNVITRWTAIVIVVSLFGWILFLLGVNLPYKEVLFEDTVFYHHRFYYFFLYAVPPVIGGLPRFSSFFLEPGHLASTCVLLLYANKFNFRRWESFIFLLAIIFSFSLAGYMLLVGGILIYAFLKSRAGFIRVSILLLLFMGVFLFFANFKGGNNVVNEKIISRLQFEDGKMTGYNRSTVLFEWKYRTYFKENKELFGMGRFAFGEIDGKVVTKNYTLGTAGWKRYYFIKGIVGSVLILSFLLLGFIANPSVLGFGFFIVYLVCNIIRDYPLSEYWMYLFLIALPIFKHNNNKLV